MLDSVALVHMNGRVYDPYLGRFLSADTVIQNLAATQSINPYAYAWNDPLKYVDPSGHGFFDILFDIIAVAVGAVFGWEVFLALGGGFWGAVIGGFVGGFVSAALLTGSLSAALTAGLVAAVTAGLLYNLTPIEQAIAKVAVGCVQASASGGNCGRGAEAAVFALLAPTPPIAGGGGTTGVWGTALATVEAGLIGGIESKIAGGSFENGFSNAAGGYLGTDIVGNIPSSTPTAEESAEDSPTPKTQSTTQTAYDVEHGEAQIPPTFIAGRLPFTLEQAIQQGRVLTPEEIQQLTRPQPGDYTETIGVPNAPPPALPQVPWYLRLLHFLGDRIDNIFHVQPVVVTAPLCQRPDECQA